MRHEAADPGFRRASGRNGGGDNVAVPVGVGNDREPIEDLLAGLAVVAGHGGDQLAGDQVDPLAVSVREACLVVGADPRGVRVIPWV